MRRASGLRARTSILAIWPTSPIISGVASVRSKSKNLSSLIFLIRLQRHTTAQSRRRRGRNETSPGADVAEASQSRRRCGKPTRAGLFHSLTDHTTRHTEQPRVLDSRSALRDESGCRGRGGVCARSVLFCADDRRSSAPRLLGLVATRKNGDPDLLADAVRQVCRAAHYDVALLRVEVEPARKRMAKIGQDETACGPLLRSTRMRRPFHSCASMRNGCVHTLLQG